MSQMGERFYTEEQAQEILRVASQSSFGMGDISRERLLETAAELGISPEDVIRAERAVLEKQELESDRAAFRKHVRKELFGKVSRWLSLAVLLYGIAFVMNGYELNGLWNDWPKWPVGITGLIMVKETIENLLELTVNRDAAFDRWRKKHARKPAPETAKEVGSTVSLSVRLGPVDGNASDQQQVLP
jgi:hypothetical protein